MAGLVWTYVWTFVGFGFIIVSLSEMASMSVTPLFRKDLGDAI